MSDSVDFFLYDYCVWGWFTPEGECLHISSGRGVKATRFKDLGAYLSAEIHQHPYINVRFLRWSESSKDLLVIEDQMVTRHKPRFKKPQQISRTNHPDRPPASNARKERPRCRKAIIRGNFRPVVKNGIWDGYSCIGPGDNGHWTLTYNMRIQMRKMATEGYWGRITIITPRKVGGG